MFGKFNGNYSIFSLTFDSLAVIQSIGYRVDPIIIQDTLVIPVHRNTDEKFKNG